MADRFCVDSFSARALPPLRPPETPERDGGWVLPLRLHFPGCCGIAVRPHGRDCRVGKASTRL